LPVANVLARPHESVPIVSDLRAVLQGGLMFTAPIGASFHSRRDVQFITSFCDLPGTMQHFTVPVEVFDREGPSPPA